MGGERGLRLILLHLLSQGPRYGYQLLQELEDVLGRRPSPGTLYPLLRGLLREGLVEARLSSRGGRIVKIYSLTEKGRGVLERSRREVEDVLYSLRALHMARDAGFDDVLRELWRLVKLLPELSPEKRAKVARFLGDLAKSILEFRTRLGEA